MNAQAEVGATDEVVLKIGAVINGWIDLDHDGIPNKPKGYDDRLEKFHKLKKYMKL